MWRDGSLNCGENTTINPHSQKAEYLANMRQTEKENGTKRSIGTLGRKRKFPINTPQLHKCLTESLSMTLTKKMLYLYSQVDRCQFPDAMVKFGRCGFISMTISSLLANMNTLM